MKYFANRDTPNDPEEDLQPVRKENEVLMAEFQKSKGEIEALKAVALTQKRNQDQEEALKAVRAEREDIFVQLEAIQRELRELRGSENLAGSMIDEEGSQSAILEAERRAREEDALRLADMQHELARRRDKVRLRSSSVNSPRTHKINISSIEELLSHFYGTGGTFDSWKRQVILLKTTYNLDEDITRILMGS